jgi:Domain of unknown function (DUF1843)
MASKSRATSKSGAKSSASKSKSGARSGPIMPYGAPINDAISRGDRAEMRRLLTSAKSILKNNASLEKAVGKLEAALKKG